jgi:hypothetical protein
MIEAVGSFESWMHYLNTWHHIPEDNTLNGVTCVGGYRRGLDLCMDLLTTYVMYEHIYVHTIRNYK